MSGCWVRVTKKHPCPICGKPDWCCYTADGRVVLCMRMENDRPSRGRAGGWVYRMENPDKELARPFRHEPRDEHISEASLYNMLNLWKRETGNDRYVAFAKSLGAGVKPDAIRRLGGVYCKARYAWAFPMRDENGVAVGVRFRDGKSKYSVRGSRDGLFFDPESGPSDTAWLTEGPTDTAALMSIAPGELVIGRSSLLSPWQPLKSCLWRLGVKSIILCVDCESEKAGREDSPGRDGNKRLVEFLGLPARFVVPPGCKDIREFVNGGGTIAGLRALLARPRGRGWMS